LGVLVFSFTTGQPNGACAHKHAHTVAWMDEECMYSRAHDDRAEFVELFDFGGGEGAVVNAGRR